MFVLLLHKMTFDKLSSLHLERQDFWHLINPCSLRGFVPLAIFVILIVRHFSTEHILPGLVEIIFVLDVQDDIMLNFCVRLSLRKGLFVHKLD